MEGLLSQLEHWHWWILGALLIILEVLSPTFFFIWLGLAAGVVGALLWMMPELGWKAQILWFSGLSLVSAILWHGVAKRRPTPTDQPTLNRRGSQYVGRTLTLTAAIENGVGRVRVDDTTWSVAGPDAPAGARIRVTGVEGSTLQVELPPAPPAGANAASDPNG